MLPDADVLSNKFLTMAELLRNANYDTAAFVFNPSLATQFNFGQGFDLYDDNKEGFDKSLPLHEACDTAVRIYTKVQTFLKKKTERPIFLYLHYRDVHVPYAPPPPYNELFLSSANSLLDIEKMQEIIKDLDKEKDNLDLFVSQYDGEISYVDYHIERIFNLLNKYSIDSKNSIFIITADHGDEFFDFHPLDSGGYSHGRTLYKEQVHVPLIISTPNSNFKERIVDAFVELVDIVPTILDLLNFDWKNNSQFQGESLMPLVQKETTECFGSHPVYSGGHRDRAIVIDSEWKYYTYTMKDLKEMEVRPSDLTESDLQVKKEELYNIKEDFFETNNQAGEREDILVKMRTILSDLIKRYHSEAKNSYVMLDHEMKDKLKSLGYLQ